jgi:nucleotide-binding universal stress UspA family protein
MLVPLDGSKLAEETFPYARELAGRLDLDLDFLVVVLRSHIGTRGQAYGTGKSVRAQIQKIQATMVEEKAIRPVEVRGAVAIGYPAEEILKYAGENKVDIILMSTHGASGVRLWALGSVAYKILHASKVPVLLIRSEAPQQIVYDKWPRRTILVPLDGSKLAESALPHAEAWPAARYSEYGNCAVSI